MTSGVPPTGQALRLIARAETAADLAPAIVSVAQPSPGPGDAVVEVLAAAVNPSDVKAALGLMPQAVWPRTPGRDYAGCVVAGPPDWLGAAVWGTGGDLGMTRDGTHARYLVLPVDALARKPERVPIAAAATVGVPFVTAHEGLRRAGPVGPGRTVVVFGANGKVGQAAVQLAARAGATVIGVERDPPAVHGPAGAPVRVLDARQPELARALLDATGGRGADVACNTVGSPYFQLALDTLAVGGTQVLISTVERTVPFDILAFYRRNLRMVGVDSLKLSAADCARILDTLRPGFDDSTLTAYDIDAARLLPLAQAADAYRRVLAGSRERVVLAP